MRPIRLLLPGFLVPVLLVLMTSCNEKKTIHGKEFVDQEVLVEMLVDIHLADGITNDRKFHRIYDADSIDVFTPILDKHQVSREMFDTTLAMYGRYPELLDKVYNEVLIKLNVMLDENDKSNREEEEPEEALSKGELSPEPPQNQ